jgi:uncharacterized BrkB/YihY/UPF0761 family membrane protein
MMKKRVKKVYISLVEVLKRNEMRILPGQIAFYFLMSIIPIAALSVFIGTQITINYDLFQAEGNDRLVEIKEEVRNFCSKFPLYPELLQEDK